MAIKASKTNNKQRSYAAAVKAEEEKSNFAALAVCRLKQPPNLPHKRIPNTKELFSFFIDYDSTDATEEEMLNAVTIDGISGTIIRDDLRVVEFVCESEDVVDTALATTFTVPDKKPFVAIMPRQKANRLILIKLANVPFSKEEELSKALTTYWTQYGKVLDLAPYKFPGKPWLLKRWDILLQLNDGEKTLKAPPVFHLDGYTDSLVASWPRSPKACLRCKIAGHSTSSCPENIQKIKKVGALANPHQKIAAAGETKNRTAKATQGTTSATATSATLATKATPAMVAQPNLAVSATTGQATPATLPEVEFNVTFPATPLTAAVPTGSELLPSFSFGQTVIKGKGPEVQRIHTPPPLTQPDPVTPMKERKRQAKAEAWTPTVDEVIRYVTVHQLCRKCFKSGHPARACTTGRPEIPFGSVSTHPLFEIHLQRWIEERRNTKRPTRYIQCLRCMDVGHSEEECTQDPVCDFCGKLECDCDPPEVSMEEEEI
ncbi:MAG TPA: hypothetical protein VK667_00045 [Ktedonobacteraceae bacterium]|nr:hypothetical protein [Ktedonobacteraceae bacterium]